MHLNDYLISFYVLFYRHSAFSSTVDGILFESNLCSMFDGNFDLMLRVHNQNVHRFVARSLFHVKNGKE